MTNPRVLVIYNEPVLPQDHPDAASEHDVIEASGIVFDILKDAGFLVWQIGFAHDPQPLLDKVRDHAPDVVFNMFEGLATQTATEVSVVALLEWLNIACTGCPSAAIALGRDKIRTKYLLKGANLPTAEFCVVEQLPAPRWPHAWPAIVKPACQDCSIGIEQASVVTNHGEMAERVAHVLNRYGPPVLVEEFISGRELLANLFEERSESTGCLKLHHIPLGEIRFELNPDQQRWPIYSYDAKWNPATDEFQQTPHGSVVQLPPALADEVDSLAAQTFRLLGLRDCGRIDIRLSPDGRPHVLEANPNPYLHSEFIIEGLEAMGRTHAKFIEGMVWNALARKDECARMNSAK